VPWRVKSTLSRHPAVDSAAFFGPAASTGRRAAHGFLALFCMTREGGPRSERLQRFWSRISSATAVSSARTRNARSRACRASAAISSTPPSHPSRPHRQANRGRHSHRVSQRGGRRALRHRSAEWDGPSGTPGRHARSMPPGRLHAKAPALALGRRWRGLEQVTGATEGGPQALPLAGFCESSSVSARGDEVAA
jgi:hypothetical protein